MTAAIFLGINFIKSVNYFIDDVIRGMETIWLKYKIPSITLLIMGFIVGLLIK